MSREKIAKQPKPNIGQVEYLYSIWWHEDTHGCSRHRVTKRTPKCVYVLTRGDRVDLINPYESEFTRPMGLVGEIEWQPINWGSLEGESRLPKDAIDLLGEVYHRPSRTLFYDYTRFSEWWDRTIDGLHRSANVRLAETIPPACLQVLELEVHQVSVDAIKAAYRRLSIRHHPDHGGDPDEFVKVDVAYKQAMERYR